MIRSVRLVALAAITTSLLAGCGAAAEKASEKATEKMIEQQTGGKVDIDTDDGSVDIETEDGSVSMGNGEIPKEWPEEIPLPDDLEVQAGTTMDSADGKLVSIIGGTDDTPEEVLASLKEALADWEISGEVTSTGGGGTMTGAQWDTEGRRVTLAATSGTEMSGKKTFVTINHTTLD